MALLKRSEIPLPELTKESVAVPELGGEVLVRAMFAAERLSLGDMARQMKERGQAAFGAEFELVPGVLSAVVLDADEQPLMTHEEWRIFGGKHPRALHELFRATLRLSGSEHEEEKKTEASA